MAARMCRPLRSAPGRFYRRQDRQRKACIARKEIQAEPPVIKGSQIEGVLARPASEVPTRHLPSYTPGVPVKLHPTLHASRQGRVLASGQVGDTTWLIPSKPLRFAQKVKGSRALRHDCAPAEKTRPVRVVRGGALYAPKIKYEEGPGEMGQNKPLSDQEWQVTVNLAVTYGWSLSQEDRNRLTHALNGNIALAIRQGILAAGLLTDQVASALVCWCGLVLCAAISMAVTQFCAGFEAAAFGNAQLTADISQLADDVSSDVRRGASAATKDAGDTPFTVVCALMVGPRGLLLARRGPDSKNRDPSDVGKFAGVGGKVDEGEDLVQALVREVKEEVGLDISQHTLIPTHTERHDDFTVSFFVVWVDSSEEITVPELERRKVVDPTWFQLDRIPYDEMNSDMVEAVESSEPYFIRSAFLAGADPMGKKWINRGEVPTGYDVIFVNNKDNLCTAYAINAQLPEPERLDLAHLGTIIGEKGFSPAELLVMLPGRTLAVWDARGRYWDGNPLRSDLLLMWTQNGSGGHWDGLRRSTTIGSPQDVVAYPQGRSALANYVGTSGEDAPITHAPGTQVPGHDGAAKIGPPPEFAFIMDVPEDLFSDAIDCGVIPTINGDYRHLEPMRNMSMDERADWLKKSIQAATQPGGGVDTPAAGIPPTAGNQDLAVVADVLSQVTPPVNRESSKIPGLASSGSIDKRVSGSVKGSAALQHPDAELYFAGDNTVTNVEEDSRQKVVAIDEYSDVFLTPTYGEDYKAGSTQDGVARIMNLLFDYTVDDIVETTPSPVAQTISVKTEVRDPKGSIHQTSHIMDTSRYADSHRITPVANVCVRSYPERSSQIVRDLRTIFPPLDQPTRLVNYVMLALTSMADAGGSGGEYWFERLWSGYHAVAAGGCVGRGGNAGNQDTLFPNDEAWNWIFGVPGVNVPGNYRGGVFQPSTTTGMTGVSILSIRSMLQGRYPEIVAAAPGRLARDWRVVLGNFHRTALGLHSPDSWRIAVNQPNASRRQSVFLDAHRFEIPNLVFLMAFAAPVGIRGAWDNTAINNPYSWLDAIAVLLQNFGGSAACIAGYQSMIRMSARFISPLVTELPVSMELRYNIPGLTEMVMRRLIMMRVCMPITQDEVADQARLHTLMIGRFNAAQHTGLRVYQAAWLAEIQAAAPMQIDVMMQAWFPGAVPGWFPELRGGMYAQHAAVIEVSASWHQFFASVRTGYMDDLREILTAMPSSTLNSLLFWLRADVYAAFGLDNRNFVNAEMNYSPARLPGAEADIPVGLWGEAVEHGVHYDRSCSLNVLNLTEIRQVIVPAGLGLLLSHKIGTEIYHSDDAALLLAGKLVTLTGPSLINKFAIIATQWRSAADAASMGHQLNAAKILTKMGSVTTGNRDLDTRILDSSEKIRIGGMRELLNSYVGGIGEALAGFGYQMAMAAEHASGVTTFCFPTTDHWDYTERDLGAEAVTPLLIWRVLHPLVNSVYLPPVADRIMGGIVRPMPEVYSTYVMGNNVPWSMWRISSQIMATEVMGGLRLITAGSGYAITLETIVRFKSRRGGGRLREYNVTGTLNHRAPRLSDSAPWSMNLGNDQMWWVVPLLEYSMDPVIVDDEDSFIRPTPTLCYHGQGRFSPHAPTIPLVEHVATGRIVGDRRYLNTANLAGYAAGRGIVIPSTATAGMLTHGAVPFVDQSGELGQHGLVADSWFSAQTSQNRVYNRGSGGYHAVSVATRQLGQNINLTKIDGVDMIMRGGISSAFRAHAISYLPRPDPRPVGQSEMLWYHTLMPSVAARFAQWAFKPHIHRLPINNGRMGPMSEMASVQSFAPEVDTSTPFSILASHRFNSIKGSYAEKLPESTDVEPPTVHQAMTYAQPTVVETDRYPGLHLVPGLSSLQRAGKLEEGRLALQAPDQLYGRHVQNPPPLPRNAQGSSATVEGVRAHAKQLMVDERRQRRNMLRMRSGFP